MGDIKILWVDPDHMWVWKTFFRIIRREGFAVIEHEAERGIAKKVQGMDAFVIHCGTLNPMANLPDLLREIRTINPKMAIGLETNAPHPFVEGLYDFIVDKPISAGYCSFFGG